MFITVCDTKSIERIRFGDDSDKEDSYTRVLYSKKYPLFDAVFCIDIVAKILRDNTKDERIINFYYPDLLDKAETYENGDFE